MTIAPGFKPTNGRQPKTGERKLIVQFRNGETSKYEYTAAQIRWTDTGDSFDVVGAKYA